MRCKFNKSDGRQCGSYAVNNSDYCFRHTPNNKTEALEASSRGGKAKRQYLSFGDEITLEKPEDIKNLMAKAINKLWTGQMPSNNPAGSIGFLAKIFLEACEKADLEESIKEIEKKLEQVKL